MQIGVDSSLLVDSELKIYPSEEVRSPGEVLFSVRISRVFYGSQGQTQSQFLVCNLRPVFEKVKFDVRRSLEPFKDLDGRFDPSLAHFKC